MALKSLNSCIYLPVGSEVVNGFVLGVSLDGSGVLVFMYLSTCRLCSWECVSAGSPARWLWSPCIC